MKNLFIAVLLMYLANDTSAQLVSYNNLNFVPETTPPYVAAVQAATAKSGYSLIWQDEFEYTSLSQLNTKWDTPNISDVGSGVYFRTTSSTTAFVTNDWGTKSIRMYVNRLATPYQGCDYEGGFLTSKTHFIMGYYEARIKLSNGRGAWPAFWLFGNNGWTSGEGGPNYAGSYNEIDIMEAGPDKSFSKHTTWSGHAWHYNSQGGAVSDSYAENLGRNSVYYSGDKDLGEEYHIYGLEFTATSLTYYLDGVIIGTVTGNQAFIDKLKKQAMWVAFDNGIETTFEDHTTPSSNYFDIDYVRIYKKNPTIAVASHTCTSGNNITLVASNPDWYAGLPSGKSIAYQWTINAPVPPNVTIVGSSTSNTVTLSNPGNAAFSLTCTTHVYYPDWYVSSSSISSTIEHEILSTTFQYPNIFSNVFNIGTPQCNGSQISVTVTGVTNPPGGMWQLWYTDANGFINGQPLQYGYGTSITFNNLQLGIQYAVTRGTWDACTPWSFTQKNFKVSLSDFNVSAVTCTVNWNKFQFTCTALNNITGASWYLYPCDAYGNVNPFSTPVVGSGLSYTFNNLNPDSYYKLFRNEQSNCSGSGSSTSKVIYVPDFTLDPYFESAVYPDPFSVNFTVTGYNPITSPLYWWGIYNSNSSGDPLSQYGAFQSGTSCSFGPANGYNLYDGNYYLLVHAAYGDCSLWNWRGHLILNNTRQGGPTVIQEVELDSSQIAMMQSQLVLDSSGNHFQALRCYPNPSSGTVNLELPASEYQFKIEVYNQVGELVVEDITNKTQYSMDLKSMASGLYYIKVYNDYEIYTDIIIKE